MNMDIGYSKDEINQAQREAVTKNHLDSAYLRVCSSSRKMAVPFSV
jgi:branched-subunit amino acid aminotransferase/4-amino-4-deoxychorismate lyase